MLLGGDVISDCGGFRTEDRAHPDVTTRRGEDLGTTPDNRGLEMCAEHRQSARFVCWTVRRGGMDVRSGDVRHENGVLRLSVRREEGLHHGNHL